MAGHFSQKFLVPFAMEATLFRFSLPATINFSTDIKNSLKVKKIPSYSGESVNHLELICWTNKVLKSFPSWKIFPKEDDSFFIAKLREHGLYADSSSSKIKCEIFSDYKTLLFIQFRTNKFIWFIYCLVVVSWNMIAKQSLYLLTLSQVHLSNREPKQYQRMYDPLHFDIPKNCICCCLETFSERALKYVHDIAM